METALRWILLAAGLVLVAGLWGWGLWRERQAARRRLAEARAARAALTPEEAEAALAALQAEVRRGRGRAERAGAGSAATPAGGDAEPGPGTRSPGPGAEPRQGGRRGRGRAERAVAGRFAAPAGGAADEPELVIALHVAARRGPDGRRGRFAGEALARALDQCGLEPGPRRIYHHMSQGRPVFSVASMVKPGHLEPEMLAGGFSTPGLALFLALPGPVSGREAFDRMLETARRLAAHLDGELLDERRSALTPQTVAWLRERVAGWDLRHRRRPAAP